MNNTIKDSIKLRQTVNREIILELSNLVEEQPTMRFGQIISAIFPNWSTEKAIHSQDLISMIFNEEPSIHLARLTKDNNE